MDADLEAIRQARMRQLQMSMGGGGGAPTPEEQEAKEEQRRAAEDQRSAMLTMILDPKARERLARIALVKPEKAQAVENSLIAAARSGRLQEKVSEEALIAMLEKASEKDGAARSGPKVTVVRRRMDDDW